MEIFVHRDGQQLGPYSVEEIRARLSDGTLALSDQAWTEGLGDWTALSSFAAFKEMTADTATTAPPLPARQPSAGVTVHRPAPLRSDISRDSLGSYALSTLQPNETPLHRTFIHPIVMVVGVVSAGFISLFFVLPLMVALISDGHLGAIFLLLIPIIVLLPGLITVKTSELLITDRRVIIKVGLLQRRTLEMFISKIESVSVRQGVLGRTFGYGDVIIRGTGGSAEVFRRIAAPLEFRNAIQRVQGASEAR